MAPTNWIIFPCAKYTHPFAEQTVHASAQTNRFLIGLLFLPFTLTDSSIPIFVLRVPFLYILFSIACIVRSVMFGIKTMYSGIFEANAQKKKTNDFDFCNSKTQLAMH